jgi:DNA-binding transcriptional regulator YiaG
MSLVGQVRTDQSLIQGLRITPQSGRRNDMSQREKILNAEERLGVGPVELARRLGAPYDTLKDWKSERRVMNKYADQLLTQLIEASMHGFGGQE